MPSEEVMKLYKEGRLHSGKKVKGKRHKVVHNKKQAKAILLSYLRREGKIGARKGTKKRTAQKG